MADFYPQVLSIALHRFLGLAALDEQEPARGVWFTVAGPSETPGGYLHGGVVSTVLDVAAFFALIPSLDESENAATVDLSVQLLRQVPTGARVELRGELLRRSRNLAFIRAVTTVDGTTVATAQFTKAISRPKA